MLGASLSASSDQSADTPALDETEPLAFDEDDADGIDSNGLLAEEAALF
ncbi:MAG: hypothetical protein ACFB6R_13940 [Alphaproteobacteria bacterium]